MSSKKDPVLVAFGNKIRKTREGKDLTQERLAEKANLDQTYISGIERGVRNPGIKNVFRIAKGLGVSAAELVDGVSA